eukprot:TRINITY_DN8736_c0_g1_i1.p1 TRINITY_DN8736_c0_g1~~TRINITY_DN8736_c0_g1_i1.p1  ORF type:complete len:605 (+),score=148.41 TRINITY_DN8736_c0_g1_i1:44-1816(+)
MDEAFGAVEVPSAEVPECPVVRSLSDAERMASDIVSRYRAPSGVDLTRQVLSPRAARFLAQQLLADRVIDAQRGEIERLQSSVRRSQHRGSPSLSPARVGPESPPPFEDDMAAPDSGVYGPGGADFAPVAATWSGVPPPPCTPAAADEVVAENARLRVELSRLRASCADGLLQHGAPGSQASLPSQRRTGAALRNCLPTLADSDSTPLPFCDFSDPAHVADMEAISNAVAAIESRHAAASAAPVETAAPSSFRTPRPADEAECGRASFVTPNAADGGAGLESTPVPPEPDVLPDGWRKHRTGGGRTYYSHRASGRSQWQPPEASQPERPLTININVTMDRKNGRKADVAVAASGPAVTPAPAPVMTPASGRSPAVAPSMLATALGSPAASPAASPVHATPAPAAAAPPTHVAAPAAASLPQQVSGSSGVGAEEAAALRARLAALEAQREELRSLREAKAALEAAVHTAAQHAKQSADDAAAAAVALATKESELAAVRAAVHARRSTSATPQPTGAVVWRAVRTTASAAGRLVAAAAGAAARLTLSALAPEPQDHPIAPSSPPPLRSTSPNPSRRLLSPTRPRDATLFGET